MALVIEKRKYEYTPLETPTSIRVLRLAPGQGNEPLRGEILHTDLGKGCQDDALSDHERGKWEKDHHAIFRTERNYRSYCTRQLFEEEKAGILGFRARKDVLAYDVYNEFGQPPCDDDTLPVGIDHRATCNGCDSDIRGVRHKCLSCQDWNYCTLCMKNAEASHPGHFLVPLREPLAWTCSGCVEITNDDTYLFSDCPNRDHCSACTKSADMSHSDQSLALLDKSSIDYFSSRCQTYGVYWPHQIGDKNHSAERTDRGITLLNPNTTYSNFRDRNSDAFYLWQLSLESWQPRTWVPYEAVSYVWGNTVYNHTLHTPHGLICITESASQALRHLRRSEHRRNLWVDGICINQSNIQERGHQVKLMGRVYSSAEGVLAWLGPDPRQRSKHTFRKKRRGEVVIRCMSNLKYARSRAEKERATLELLENSWFKRVWVVQEFALARQAIFQWGHEQLDEVALFFCILAFRAPLRTWINELEIYHSNGAIQKGKFLDLMHIIGGLGCSNGHDHVYGILGLTHLLESSYPTTKVMRQLTPNYEDLVEETYFEVASLYVRSGEVSSLLSFAESFSAVGNGLQSWVPDWRSPTGVKPLLYVWEDGKRRSTAAWVDQSTGVLSITGLELGCVDLLTHTICDPDDLSGLLDAVLQLWLARPNQPLRLSPSCILQPGEFESVLLLLLGGMTHDPRKPWVKSRLEDRPKDFLHTISGPDRKAEKRLWNSINRDLRAMQMITSLAGYEVAPNYKRLSYEMGRKAYRLGRRFFQTEVGLLGIGPGGMRKGDQLILIDGECCPVPIVVRKAGDNHIFVGIAGIPALLTVNEDPLSRLDDIWESHEHSRKVYKLQ
jgi:hypothetical protein